MFMLKLWRRLRFNIVVLSDSEHKSRRFGLVNFEKAEAVVNAIEKMNKTIVDKKELYVGRA